MTTQLLIPQGANAISDSDGNVYTPTAGIITVPSQYTAQFLNQGFRVLGSTMLIGQLLGANMNVTTDQIIPLNVPVGSLIMLDSVLVLNPSTSLTTAAGGLYTAASKGGTAVVAAAQAYSAATTAATMVRCTIAAAGLAAVLSQQSLYFALTTGQGAAATADIFVYGRALVL